MKSQTQVKYRFSGSRLEIVMLLLAYLVYGYNKSSISYTILSISSWFVAVSWLFAPSIFNPSGFEWQK